MAKHHFLLTLGVSEPIRNLKELATNAAEAVLHHAMDMGISPDDEKGYVTDIVIGALDGSPLVHVRIDGHIFRVKPVENNGFEKGPSAKQKAGLQLVATGLLSIAEEMQRDENFREWIESTPFFESFNRCIEEIGQMTLHILCDQDDER